MNYCNSCGGAIGRDCFNPIECQQISRNQDDYVQELEYKVEKLTQVLKENRIEIPKLEPKHDNGIVDYFLSFVWQSFVYINPVHNFLSLILSCSNLFLPPIQEVEVVV